jgi:Vitamin K-dependent gamma-carboxylase
VSRVIGLLREKLDRFALAEASSRPLGLVRILITLAIIYEFASPWVSHRVDDDARLLVVSWIMFIANWFMLVGWKTRVVSKIWWVSFGIIHLYFGRHLDVLDMQQPVLVFQIMTLVAFAPAGRSLSIDRAREVRKARREGRQPAPERIPYFVYDLFALVIASIYFWAGQDKTDAAWLRGERMEHYYLLFYGGSDSLMARPWIHEIAMVMAWATTVLELTLAFGLILRRTRVYVVFGGFVLHIGIMFYFAVTYFSMAMMMVLFACLPPQWFHDFIAAIGDDGEPASPPRSDPTSSG